MREIMGEYLDKPFKSLGISPKCKYAADVGHYKHLEVWEISDSDYSILDNTTEDQWQLISDNDDSWYRYSEGSNCGAPNESFQINGETIMAWRNEDKVQDLVDEYNYLSEYNKSVYDNVYDYINTWLSTSYRNIFDYFYNEMGVSTERNICALATDLAKYNNITMAQLFSIYTRPNNKKEVIKC